MIQKKWILLLGLLLSYQLTQTMDQRKKRTHKKASLTTQSIADIESMPATKKAALQDPLSQDYLKILKTASALTNTTTLATEEVDSTTSPQAHIALIKQLSSIQNMLTPLLTQKLHSLEKQNALAAAALNAQNPLINNLLQFPYFFFRHLSVQDICSLKRTCKSWRYIWSDEHLLSINTKKIALLDQYKSIPNGLKALAKILKQYKNPVEIIFRAEDLKEKLVVPTEELNLIPTLKRVVFLGDTSARIRFLSKYSFNPMLEIATEELVVNNCKLKMFISSTSKVTSLDLRGNDINPHNLELRYMPQLINLLLTINDFNNIKLLNLSALGLLENLVVETIMINQEDVDQFLLKNPNFKLKEILYKQETNYTTLVFGASEKKPQVGPTCASTPHPEEPMQQITPMPAPIPAAQMDEARVLFPKQQDSPPTISDFFSQLDPCFF